MILQLTYLAYKLMHMIKAAVLGYGYAGRCFHSYLIGLADGIELYAVCARNPKSREAAKTELGIKTFENLSDCLQDPLVDLVVIATPHDTHAALAIQALNSGRHVVTDKVMCMSSNEADSMMSAAQKNGVMLSVFHNRRWDWDFSTVKKAIDTGLIGKPYYIEASIMRFAQPTGWRAVPDQSGGLFHDWGAHLIDQILLIASSRVTRIYAEAQYRGWGSSIGSFGKLLMHFECGLLGQVEIGNMACGEKPRWYILGDSGCLVKTGPDPQERAMVRGHIEDAREDSRHCVRAFTDPQNTESVIVLENVKTSWKAYYQNISDYLSGKADLAVKPAEAKRVVQILEAASVSAQSGASVAVDL